MLWRIGLQYFLIEFIQNDDKMGSYINIVIVLRWREERDECEGEASSGVDI